MSSCLAALLLLGFPVDAQLFLLLSKAQAYRCSASLCLWPLQVIRVIVALKRGDWGGCRGLRVLPCRSQPSVPLSFILPSQTSNPSISFFFLSFFFLRGTPVVYGSSQARRRVRATAAWQHHSSQQHWILLSEARDPVCILMDTSWVNSLATQELPV